MFQLLPDNQQQFDLWVVRGCCGAGLGSRAREGSWGLYDLSHHPAVAHVKDREWGRCPGCRFACAGAGAWADVCLSTGAGSGDVALVVSRPSWGPPQPGQCPWAEPCATQ